jgi:hypothetical protein
MLAYIEALKDFWLAQTELEKSLGGKLPAIQSSTAEKIFSYHLPNKEGKMFFHTRLHHASVLDFFSVFSRQKGPSTKKRLLIIHLII